jgi:hypothetical protein
MYEKCRGYFVESEASHWQSRHFQWAYVLHRLVCWEMYGRRAYITLVQYCSMTTRTSSLSSESKPPFFCRSPWMFAAHICSSSGVLLWSFSLSGVFTTEKINITLRLHLNPNLINDYYRLQCVKDYWDYAFCVAQEDFYLPVITVQYCFIQYWHLKIYYNSLLPSPSPIGFGLDLKFCQVKVS